MKNMEHNNDFKNEMENATSEAKELAGGAEKKGILEVIRDFFVDKNEKDELKRNRKTALRIAIVACVVAVLCLSIALMVIFIPKQSKDGEKEDNYSFVRQVYCYALVIGDEGVMLDDEWMLGCGSDIFTVEFDSEIVAVSDRAVSVAQGVTEEKETEIKYLYKGNAVAIFNIKVFKDAEYVESITDLLDIAEGSTGNYIQKNDLNLNGKSVQIKNFHGGYYGNHHIISGLNVSGNGGLFGVLNGAEVCSIELRNVVGEIGNEAAASMGICDKNKLPSVGAMVNYAYGTNIEYCSVSGSFSVNMNGGNVNVGGIAGMFDDADRRSDYDYTINYANYCDADVAITVSCGYALDGVVDAVRVGGIVGFAHNGSVNYAECKGKIDGEFINVERVYIGGIIGMSQKESGNFANEKIHQYETLTSLVNHVELDINIAGDNTSFSTYAGGVFGYLENTNVCNAESDGILNLKAGASAICAGGLAGAMVNQNTSGIVIKMTATEIGTLGALNMDIKSTGYVNDDVGFISEKTIIEKK